MATRNQIGNPFRSLYPTVPDHPIQSALREALCQKWDRIEELVSIIGTTGGEEKKMLRTAEELIRTLHEWRELQRWIHPPRKALSKQQADGVANTMLEAGYSASEALAFAKAVQRRPHSRPADKRPLAIAALELRRADAERWTWKALAKQTYGCQHLKRCECGERLRQEVIHLKRFLAKVCITLPNTPRK